MADQSASQTIPKRRDYHWFCDIHTRWQDNDVYGHVNNVQYYAYFDTIANRYLIEFGGLDIHEGAQIGYIVHSECFYHRSAAFPQQLCGAFRVNRIGNSSVEYGVAVFEEGAGEDDTAIAQGRFTHVFVDRHSEKPVPIDAKMRAALEDALISA